MNNPSDNILAAHKLCKQVPSLDNTVAETINILQGVELEIKSAETVAILGISGSGKSTLLGLLAGLDTPTSGTITIAGQSLNSLSEDGRAEIRSSLVGFVFQSFHLLPNLNALENVMLPLELKSAADAEARATRLLERVGLSHRLQHYPRQLSGGEQQRVAIARAFVVQPAIVFADEPTGNLDSATSTRIIDLLFDINREHKTTLVMVTHDDNLAALCQRRFNLDEGLLKEVMT